MADYLLCTLLDLIINIVLIDRHTTKLFEIMQVAWCPETLNDIYGGCDDGEYGVSGVNVAIIAPVCSQSLIGEYHSNQWIRQSKLH